MQMAYVLIYGVNVTQVHLSLLVVLKLIEQVDEVCVAQDCASVAADQEELFKLYDLVVVKVNPFKNLSGFVNRNQFLVMSQRLVVHDKQTCLVQDSNNLIDLNPAIISQVKRLKKFIKLIVL